MRVSGCMINWGYGFRGSDQGLLLLMAMPPKNTFYRDHHCLPLKQLFLNQHCSMKILQIICYNNDDKNFRTTSLFCFI